MVSPVRGGCGTREAGAVVHTTAPVGGVGVVRGGQGPVRVVGDALVGGGKV